MRVRRNRDFEVVGAGFFQARNDVMAGSRAVIDDASLTSLRHAYARYARAGGGDPSDPESLLVTDVPPEGFDADFVPYDPVQLKVDAEGVAVTTWMDIDEPLQSTRAVAQLLAPLLQRHRARLLSIERIEGIGAAAVGIEAQVPTRGRTVAHAIAFGHDLRRLLAAAFATPHDGFDAEVVAELLRTGHGRVLEGQPETGWLDVKGRVYDLDDEYGKFAFARDVAAFANAGGGVLAIGLSSRRSVRGETIGAVRPVDISHVSSARHHAVLRDWLHPRPVGVRIDVIADSDNAGRGVVVVEIPPQPSAAVPFFVRRAEIAGRLRTDHYAVPIRLGESTAAWDVAELHTLIVAGRAALGVSRRPHPELDRPAPLEANLGKRTLGRGS